MPKKILDIVNIMLTVVIVCLAMYIIFLPLLPEADLYIKRNIVAPSNEDPVFISQYSSQSQGQSSSQRDGGTAGQPAQDSSGKNVVGNLFSRVGNIIRGRPSSPTKASNTTQPSLQSNTTQGTQPGQQEGTTQQQNPQVAQTEENPTQSGQTPGSSIPNQNVLLVPQIGVDGLIIEGNSPYTLNKGIWRRPNTSTPDQGGNTVLVAHRFLYTTGPNTFYHLPKMQVNDQFAIFWKGRQYVYEVYEVKEVLPSAIEIEENTSEPIVTLYTCTPLWTSKYRFVVRARLLQAS